MRALVTGANGFLGVAVVERLLAHQVEHIRCLVRPGSDTRRLEQTIAQAIAQAARDCVEVRRGSLASAADLDAALAQVDVVLHLAAGMKGSPADLFLNSVISSRHLLEGVVRSGRRPRIVLVSSFGVYGTAALGRGATINEQSPLETEPQRRDAYSYAKLRQERLFHEYAAAHGLPLTVLRPGVIYGPAGSPMSTRVGLNVFGYFFHLGGSNLLPLSYVENCAEAIVLAAKSPQAVGEIYNVHDTQLLTCKEYLRGYRREVRRMRTVRLPYRVTYWLSGMLERYHRNSGGQLPAVLTPYKVATSWKGMRFDNSKLRALGWKELVSTSEGIRRTFTALRAQQEEAKSR